MARKTKAEAERTYHALLDAATLLFIEQGVAKTTLNDIAHRADMTRGAVYWHFKNKDAVIQALWERNAKTMHDGFVYRLKNLDMTCPAADFRDAIKALLRRAVTDPQLSQAMRIVMHCIEFTDEKTELQRFLYTCRDEFYEALQVALQTLEQQGALRRDLPVAVLISSLWAYLNGLVHTNLEPGSKTVDLQAYGDKLLDLWLDAVLK
ncbi:TetR family transcriptional regulator [Candidatus Venteria ishoeyi]|uniref:HTH-type transcriptional regulator TtgR n=1 Tax=Candidatus Venteria ishoeyi TaxID=1899563 RepID=A0A1H6F6V0_9GAMM|nr:TetR family transcriptional regulator [Candidatus Venteria ishoeyi]SEH05870.1 HTH-type transcriptional regulator TtgR [Candidatus Venteria ishoeyi]